MTLRTDYHDYFATGIDSVKSAAVADPVEILQRKVYMKGGRAGFEVSSNGCANCAKKSTTETGTHGIEGA
jgi:hypothetical protein